MQMQVLLTTKTITIRVSAYGKNSTEIVQEILTRSKITFKDNYTFQETKVLEGLIDPLGMDEWVVYVFFYHDLLALLFNC